MIEVDNFNRVSDILIEKKIKNNSCLIFNLIFNRFYDEHLRMCLNYLIVKAYQTLKEVT